MGSPDGVVNKEGKRQYLENDRFSPDSPKPDSPKLGFRVRVRVRV